MDGIGKLSGIGVGPGDPELITLKALKRLKEADIVAFHQAKGKKSNALTSVEEYLEKYQKRLPFVYPLTTELPQSHKTYEHILDCFYNKIIQQLCQYLALGKKVVVLAEGDPLFYSSFIYIYNRIKKIYLTEIIPGILSVSGAAAMFGAPLCYRDQVFTVLPGLLDKKKLENYLSTGDAFAIIKIGRNLNKIREALCNTGLQEKALYIERATTLKERIIPLRDVKEKKSPYFSIILIPGKL